MAGGKLFALLVAGAAAAVVAPMVARSRRNCSFDHKVVVISGGSRGLGLVLARQFADEGARLVLLARGEEKLRLAAEELMARGALVHTQVCDVGDRRQVQAAIHNVVERFGTVDVLINAAGIIEVGPLDTMTLEDFRDTMDVHFWGPLYLSLSVIPLMRAQGSGRIVNISSIGGKVSVPHLLPYCASKFALAGLSEGLRAELLKDHIYVTTVFPGLMRTGSHLNAYFKGDNKAEYSWFSISNALPFGSVAAETAARQIIRSARRGDPELIISLPAQVLSKLEGIVPGLTVDSLALANRLLPTAKGIKVTKTAGKDSRGLLSPSFLTRLSDRAALQNNEL